jgi:hypothetical protein
MKNVKFLLAVVVLLTISVTVNAQLRFGVKGGVNIANVSFDKDVLNSDNVTGFHVGPMIDASFGEGGIGLDLALLFSQKGFDTKDKSVKNTYLDLPVNLKFKFGIPLINPYLAAGPYVGFRVNGSKVKDISYKDIKHQVQSKNFGAGLNFSAGAELFDRLQIGLIYSWGLTNDYKTFDGNDLDSYKGKPHTWSISAAFLF